MEGRTEDPGLLDCPMIEEAEGNTDKEIKFELRGVVEADPGEEIVLLMGALVGGEAVLTVAEETIIPDWELFI